MRKRKGCLKGCHDSLFGSFIEGEYSPTTTKSIWFHFFFYHANKQGKKGTSTKEKKTIKESLTHLAVLAPSRREVKG